MNFKNIISLSLLTFTLTLSGCANFTKTQDQKQDTIVILHTNDVHSGIDDHIGYAGLAAYKKEMEEKYGEDNVILVDAGDAVQGSSIGMLTKGSVIIDLMNSVDYDYFVLGNHEFDYQIPHLFKLAEDLEAKIISSNFIDLKDKEPVFSAYEIHTVKGIDIAFIGVTTPESLTKASSQYFQDGKGNFIYSFEEDKTGEKLYKNVQNSIDQALAEGAEYVVAIVHLGIDEISAPWRSTDLIANTKGIDVMIDGHSHSVIEGEIHKDMAGNEVLLSQTGTKLEHIGKVLINPSKNENDIVAMLIGKNKSYTEKDPIVQGQVDQIKEDFEKILTKTVAYTDYPLYISKDDVQLSRIQETNMGNLVADAYRAMLGTDIALTNGGGIRANMDKGDISYKEIIDLHPFGNYIISMEVTGKTIKDALEMGAKSYPNPSGGFLQVSGLTYQIDSNTPSSVKVDDYGNFVAVEGKYRVKNIMIDNKPLDENKLYSVASHDYLLKKAGDGMSMFKNAKIIKDMFMIDSDVLIKFITENLNGKIGKEYANQNGNGRITKL